jgi:hypothetical protein
MEAGDGPVGRRRVGGRPDILATARLVMSRSVRAQWNGGSSEPEADLNAPGTDAGSPEIP